MEKQMAKYFKEKPEYKRLLNGIKSKYINFREIKGNIDKNYKLPNKKTYSAVHAGGSNEF